MRSSGNLEWAAPPPTGISLIGFRFSYRNSQFDWRLFHGIDPDAVVSSICT